MKKLTFTVQVFGLMAMIPIFVILEMSHGTGNLPKNNSHPIVTEKVEKQSPRKTQNSEAQNKV